MAVIVLVGVAGLVDGLVAGCGSPATQSRTHSATTTKTVTASPTATAAARTSASASATSSATTSSAQAQIAGAVCRSAQIAASVGSGTAGLGHVGEALRFRNAGSTVCVLGGYPGVALIRASGAELQAKRTPNGYLGGLAPGSQTPPLLHLRPGETASALLEGTSSQSGGGAACPNYLALLVTPPNSRVSHRVGRPFGVCAPMVHPVVPGTTGRQG